MADLLREQLPKLKTALEATDRTELAKVEIEQGEPLTYWFEYEEDSTILIDSSMPVPDGEYGFIAVAPMASGTAPLRGRVAMITDADAKPSWSTIKGNETTLEIGILIRDRRRISVGATVARRGGSVRPPALANRAL